MSADPGSGSDQTSSVDFRERSSVSLHNYPTKERLHAEQRVGESYEETILRLLDELQTLRARLREIETETVAVEAPTVGE